MLDVDTPVRATPAPPVVKGRVVTDEVVDSHSANGLTIREEAPEISSAPLEAMPSTRTWLERLGERLIHILLELDRRARTKLRRITAFWAIFVAVLGYLDDGPIDPGTVAVADALLVLLWVRFITWLALLAGDDGSWTVSSVFHEVRGRVAAKTDEALSLFDTDPISRFDWLASFLGVVGLVGSIVTTVVRIVNVVSAAGRAAQISTTALSAATTWTLLGAGASFFLARYLNSKTAETIATSAWNDSVSLPAYIDLTVAPPPQTGNVHLDTVFDVLRSRRRDHFGYEKQHHGALVRALRRRLKEIRAESEIPLGEGRIDISLPGLLYMEVKRGVRKAEADRMLGQVGRYAANAGEIPVWLILFESQPPSPELLQELQSLHERRRVVTLRVSSPSS